MKYKDKDGNTYDCYEEALKAYCSSHICADCGMKEISETGCCFEWGERNLDEFCRIAGLVIEDGEDISAPTKQDENQLHICAGCVWEDTAECMDCRNNDKFEPYNSAGCDAERTVEEVVTRESILEAARKCVCGERAQDYGEVENNFGAIREMWSTYLNAKAMKAASEGKPLTLNNADVAAMMIQVKLARQATGHAKADNWTDIAGYAACGGEIEGKEMI